MHPPRIGALSPFGEETISPYKWHLAPPYERDAPAKMEETMPFVSA
jgi:hypothetical protein